MIIETDSLCIGPKSGETWNVGAYKNIVFILMARDFFQYKYFIFKNEDKYVSISKDDFFNPAISKQLVKENK